MFRFYFLRESECSDSTFYRSGVHTQERLRVLPVRSAERSVSRVRCGGVPGGVAGLSTRRCAAGEGAGRASSHHVHDTAGPGAASMI